jgi:syntaxin 5
MPLQDRTNEFLACVESIRSRSSLPAKVPSKQRRDNKSEFTRMASLIGKDISATTVKLGKLAQREHVYAFIPSRCAEHPWLTVAKRKTLFDDRPVEISVRVPLCCSSLPKILKNIFLGAHFRYQTRHCKYQQADCNAPGRC